MLAIVVVVPRHIDVATAATFVFVGTTRVSAIAPMFFLMVMSHFTYYFVNEFNTKIIDGFCFAKLHYNFLILYWSV